MEKLCAYKNTLFDHILSTLTLISQRILLREAGARAANPGVRSGTQKAQESTQECLRCHLQPWGPAVVDLAGVRYRGYTSPFPSISGTMADCEAT